MAELKKMPSFYQIQLYELYSYSMLLLFKTFLGTLIESNILKMRSNLHEEISINIPNFGKLCNGSDGRWVDRLQGHFAVRLPSSAACPLLFQSAAEHTGPGSIKSWIPRLCDSTQGCQMANFATQSSGAVVQKPKGPNTYNLKACYSHLATMILPPGRLCPVGVHAALELNFCRALQKLYSNAGIGIRRWDRI